MGLSARACANTAVFESRRRGYHGRHIIGIATATIFAGIASHAVAAATSATSAADATQTAQAAPRKSFDIAAGPLENALSQYGQQARIMLSYPSALTANRHSAGLHGDYDTQQGLARLLRGTG